MREYAHPPYELTETGWGEFEIAVLVRCLVSYKQGFLSVTADMHLQLHFTDDSGEEPVELYHKLKLYGEDDPSGQASTKKPVSHLSGLSACQEQLFHNMHSPQGAWWSPVYGVQTRPALLLKHNCPIKLAALSFPGYCTAF